MTKPNDTIRVRIPLKVRKKNGRPKILPPAEYRPSEDQTQDPHLLRTIGRAWGWRRRMGQEQSEGCACYLAHAANRRGADLP